MFELPWGQRSRRVHERSKPRPELEPVWAFACGDCTSLHTIHRHRRSLEYSSLQYIALPDAAFCIIILNCHVQIRICLLYSLNFLHFPVFLFSFFILFCYCFFLCLYLLVLCHIFDNIPFFLTVLVDKIICVEQILSGVHPVDI